MKYNEKDIYEIIKAITIGKTDNTALCMSMILKLNNLTLSVLSGNKDSIQRSYIETVTLFAQIEHINHVAIRNYYINNIPKKAEVIDDVMGLSASILFVQKMLIERVYVKKSRPESMMSIIREVSSILSDTYYRSMLCDDKIANGIEKILDTHLRQLKKEKHKVGKKASDEDIYRAIVYMYKNKISQYKMCVDLNITQSVLSARVRKVLGKLVDEYLELRNVETITHVKALRKLKVSEEMFQAAFKKAPMNVKPILHEYSKE